MKIHIMTCGTVTVDKGVPFRDVSKNPFAYTGFLRGHSNRITIPVKAFLVEHPKGNVLIDTGWHTNVRNRPICHESLPLWFTSRPDLPKGTAITEQLSELGIKPHDISYVILTHLDVDHASGLQLVKEAKHIIASPDELSKDNLKNIRYNPRLWKGVKLESIPFKETGEGPDLKSYDLFGDGCIEIISACGHTRGSLIIKVQNGGRFVLIAGDTGYSESSWVNLRLPGPVYDKTKMLRALKWIKQMASEENCEAVLVSHDPAIADQIIEL